MHGMYAAMPCHAWLQTVLLAGLPLGRSGSLGCHHGKVGQGLMAAMLWWGMFGKMVSRHVACQFCSLKAATCHTVNLSMASQGWGAWEGKAKLGLTHQPGEKGQN